MVDRQLDILRGTLFSGGALGVSLRGDLSAVVGGHPHSRSTRSIRTSVRLEEAVCNKSPLELLAG